MNFQNIEYFLTAAEYGSFTKAAQSLYISQQSLSENIRRLEEEIGTPLFDRGKTLTLTPAGKCFQSGGSKILRTQDKMLREIAVISNTIQCKVVLGVLPMDLPPFLPQALKEYAQKYPEYEISIQSRHSTEIPDLIFCIDPPEKGMESIPLIRDDAFAVVFARALAEQTYGEHWPEVSRRLGQEQGLSVLAKMPFLLPYKNKCLLEPVDRLFEEAGFRPVEVFKSEDANLLCSLCMTGAGALIGPVDYCRRKFGALSGDAKDSTLAFYPLKSAESTTLSLVYPRGKHLNQAEKRFADVLHSVIGRSG